MIQNIGKTANNSETEFEALSNGGRATSKVRAETSSIMTPDMMPVDSNFGRVDLKVIQKHQATSPGVNSEYRHLISSAGRSNRDAASSTGSNKDLDLNQNHLGSQATFFDQDFTANDDDERKTGDARIKEGIAFLNKFYNERANMLGENRRSSNSALLGSKVNLLNTIRAAEFTRIGSQA